MMVNLSMGGRGIVVSAFGFFLLLHVCLALISQASASTTSVHGDGRPPMAPHTCCCASAPRLPTLRHQPLTQGRGPHGPHLGGIEAPECSRTCQGPTRLLNTQPPPPPPLGIKGYFLGRVQSGHCWVRSASKRDGRCVSSEF